MDYIITEAEREARQQLERDSTFTGEDGLLHCSVCGGAREAYIYVELNNIKYSLHGMNQICEGMKDGIFSFSLAHYIGLDKGIKESLYDAHDCLDDNFNVIGGAFLMMEAATNIICDALENDDLKLVPGDGKGGWKICIES